MMNELVEIYLAIFCLVFLLCFCFIMHQFPSFAHDSLGLGPLQEFKFHTRRDLIDYIKTLEPNQVIRVGATTDYDRRIAEYIKEGYKGLLCFTPCDCMRTGENILLRDCFDTLPRHNRHRRSNITEDKSGYVYIIVGSRQNI